MKKSRHGFALIVPQVARSAPRWSITAKSRRAEAAQGKPTRHAVPERVLRMDFINDTQILTPRLKPHDPP